ncbi:MAG: anaerobic ribonucleoside-triphosphate reductase [Selenomonadaceae bacterium]
MLVNGIEVTVNGIENISKQEMMGYINYIENETDENLASLQISTADEGNVSLDYKLRPAKFERIRRITGYLVGTTDRWNNAKRAEEHDRVKHGLN